MNKFVILFVFAFAYVHAEGESSSSEEDLKSIAVAAQSKLNSTILRGLIALSDKTKEMCPDIETKMNTTVAEIGTCMEGIELGDQTFCSLIRNNFERCAEPLKKLLDGCVLEESKGIPKMVIKVVKSLMDEACNSTVEQILEIFNPCVREKEFVAFDACTKVRELLLSHEDKLPSKSLLCSTLPKIKSCLTSHREASCKNPVTKAAGVHLFEAVDQGTKDECEAINETK